MNPRNVKVCFGPDSNPIQHPASSAFRFRNFPLRFLFTGTWKIIFLKLAVHGQTKSLQIDSVIGNDSLQYIQTGVTLSDTQPRTLLVEKALLKNIEFWFCFALPIFALARRHYGHNFFLPKWRVRQFTLPHIRFRRISVTAAVIVNVSTHRSTRLPGLPLPISNGGRMGHFWRHFLTNFLKCHQKTKKAKKNTDRWGRSGNFGWRKEER